MGLQNFIMEEDGVGVVEVILILVVLITLVLLFKERIMDVAGDILDKVEKDAGKV